MDAQGHSWQRVAARTHDGTLVSATAAQILRATLAFSGLCRREIALRADLSLSRLERILGGYAAPSYDEFTMIARACGHEDGLVTTPRPAGAGALPARTIFGLLLNREQHAHHDIDTCACGLSVDWLSVSFDAPTAE